MSSLFIQLEVSRITFPIYDIKMDIQCLKPSLRRCHSVKGLRHAFKITTSFRQLIRFPNEGRASFFPVIGLDILQVEIRQVRVYFDYTHINNNNYSGT